MYNNLDAFINNQNLEDLHLEICSGLAQAKSDMSSRVIPHYEMQKEFDKLFEYKNNDRARIAAVADHGESFLTTDRERSIFHSLDREQKKRFLQLYKKAYWDGEYVRIKFTKKDFSTHPEATFYNSMCEWHPNANLFPGVLKFIESLPFLEVGRVLFFISYHYLHTDVHYDRKDQVFDGKNHFIWFNPFKQKEFYLIDHNKKIHDVDCRSAFFDPRFLHGARPSPKMTYTLRVDGQLEKLFCEKVGLPWQPRTATALAVQAQETV